MGSIKIVGKTLKSMVGGIWRNLMGECGIISLLDALHHILGGKNWLGECPYVLGGYLQPLLSRDGNPKGGFFIEATLNTSVGMTLLLVIICDSPSRHWRPDEGGIR
jgi:hypothetical protein